ncbi:hypothetical protein GCM10007973_18100 [Polymorphobacter multimanifer]|uniref:Uncharacterized protein n=1 Tax=Polymorphobacter multimanifer TaxID=1070431 RepID=A0A841L6V0_9SPHN|nr:hypothetical protein [Polymorphobacter multimanifer]MBB6228324.1 hypothetical protein [Polymorphobacter multimanifer]GGI82036.1 hypothetical protein GCM10007973_18100 [Polymorphobacter multimanifer]
MSSPFPSPLALSPTPAREALVRNVEAAVSRARARKLVPKSVYLTAADAAAAEILPLPKRDPARPPHVMGLPIRPITGKGRSRLYCKHGIALSLPSIEENTYAGRR